MKLAEQWMYMRKIEEEVEMFEKEKSEEDDGRAGVWPNGGEKSEE